MNSTYADHAATTPIRPEVGAAMDLSSRESFGNPSSGHQWGRRALSALEDARAMLAEAVGAKPAEIVFTRGGTEANNLAVVGAAAMRPAGSPIVVSAFEHKAVLDTADNLGSPVIRIPVREGIGLDLGALETALADGAGLVSVMWVNNETGDVQPIARAAEMARAAGVPFHTDGVQAVGKIPVDLREAPVDLMTMTGHKLGGPTSAGALFVRSGTQLRPILQGGGQERGLRPGTQDVTGAVGLATAVRLAVAEREAKAAEWQKLGRDLLVGLRSAVPELVQYGVGLERAPHVINVGIPGHAPDVLIAALDLEGVAASGGSACSSGSTSRSYVLDAIHGGPHDDTSSGDPAAPVRFSFGWPSTLDDVAHILAAVARVHGRAATVS